MCFTSVSDWGTESVSCVKELTRNISSGIVESHEVNQEAQDSWWQAIEVGISKEGY